MQGTAWPLSFSSARRHLGARPNPLRKALVRVQHASAQTHRALQMPSCFSPFQNEYKREISMILVQRSVSVAPGMFSAAMAFANEISAQFKASTGVDAKIAIPVGGNASRIAWIANYENLAQYEAAGLKLLGDQKFQEMIKKAAGIFVPDTLHDD